MLRRWQRSAPDSCGWPLLRWLWNMVLVVMIPPKMITPPPPPSVLMSDSSYRRAKSHFSFQVWPQLTRDTCAPHHGRQQLGQHQQYERGEGWDHWGLWLHMNWSLSVSGKKPQRSPSLLGDRIRQLLGVDHDQARRNIGQKMRKKLRIL